MGCLPWLTSPTYLACSLIVQKYDLILKTFLTPRLMQISLPFLFTILRPDIKFENFARLTARVPGLASSLNLVSSVNFVQHPLHSLIQIIYTDLSNTGPYILLFSKLMKKHWCWEDLGSIPLHCKVVGISGYINGRNAATVIYDTWLSG